MHGVISLPDVTSYDKRRIVFKANSAFSFPFFLYYGKCSKISNTFLFLFLIKMLVFTACIHKMLVRVANREDPDQTVLKKQSDLGLPCLSRPFWQAISVQILEHLFTSSNFSYTWNKHDCE